MRVFYETTDFRQIEKCIGRDLSENHKEQLEVYASAFLQDYASEKRTPTHAVVDRLDRIEAAAKKLLQLTRLPHGASAQALLRRTSTRYLNIRVVTTTLDSAGKTGEKYRPSEFSDVTKAIKGVKDLEVYARVAAEDERKKLKSNNDRKRHGGNRARQTFVNNLAGLWSEMFCKLPGASIDPVTGDAFGPFIAFVLECYRPLRRDWPTLPDMTANAARTHYRNTGEAKLKRWAKSDMGKSGKKSS